MYGLLIFGASAPSYPRGEKRATGTRHKSPPKLTQNEKKRGVAKECILKEPNLNDTQVGHPAIERSIETPTKEGDATSVSMLFSTPSPAVPKLVLSISSAITRGGWKDDACGSLMRGKTLQMNSQLIDFGLSSSAQLW